MTEDKRKSEVKSLRGVATVTFRVLSLFVVMKCYSYSKIVLQLIVVPPGEYRINRFIWTGTH
jgi:heme/copper-type cytochrome/quinol oxidase subunit 3